MSRSNLRSLLKTATTVTEGIFDERLAEDEGTEDEDISKSTDEGGEERGPMEQIIDKVEHEPSAPRTISLNERIKEYVRTMHIPPVTNWRALSGSEEEEEESKEGRKEEAKFTAEFDFPPLEVIPTDKPADTSDDDWDSLLMKDKAAGPAKVKAEVGQLCLLNVRSYGSYFHAPYEEMALRNEEQCSGCRQGGELARCVCCGGCSIISPHCTLPKDHLKLRLVKESRINHLLGTGRTFSEMELRRGESSNLHGSDSRCLRHQIPPR